MRKVTGEYWSVDMDPVRRMAMNEIVGWGLDRIDARGADKAAKIGGAIDPFGEEGINQFRLDIEALGHRVIAEGGFSVICELPDCPDKVLRISRGDDGWVEYALNAQGRLHAPRVESFGHVNGLWVAVVEKLSPLARELDFLCVELWDILDRIWKEVKRPDEPEWHIPFGFAHGSEIIDIRWPELKDFLRNIVVRDRRIPDDLKPENLMMRGRDLVVSDPYANMSNGAVTVRGVVKEWTVELEPELEVEAEMVG